MAVLLDRGQIVFHFPDVHRDAKLAICPMRTLRVPDDGDDYPLPAGMGLFPLRHVDDYADNVPAPWVDRAGLMLPMHEAEAMWLNFNASHVAYRGEYPFAMKIGTGKINALTGDTWDEALNREPQDYMVSTEQPWLDGYSVGEGYVRQFVAMPLGKGYSVEEQITNSAEFGGIQIQVYPMKREAFEKHFPMEEPEPFTLTEPSGADDSEIVFKKICCEMGLAPGGRISQQIYADCFQPEDWDTDNSSRCFVHLCNSRQWQEITGEEPPPSPISSSEYEHAGIPWFIHYIDEVKVVPGSTKLASLETVVDHAKSIGEQPPDDNKSVFPKHLFDIDSDRAVD